MNAASIRPVVSGFARLLRVIPLACLLLLGGCLYGQNRDFAQLAQGEDWLALPMGRWLGTQDHGEPEAIAACLAPNCRNRMAVAVFRLEGEKARRTEAELREPQRLVEAMNARQNRNGDDDRVRFDLRTESFSTGGLDGFSLVVARRGEETPLLHAAAVGRRDGADLRVVFSVGDDAEVVRAAVAQLVAEGF
jgi:hypothetical protein